MSPRLYIGTSGWSYPAWKDSFYSGIPQKDWLHHCARHFTGIEINASFYRLQRKETYEKWHEQTPPEFRFSLKANRYLTHSKKLIEPIDPIRREREQAHGLGDKLAVVLWQLPGNFKLNLNRLEAFVNALDQWQDTRHCIEFRHASWFNRDVANCLQKHRIAACQSDAADWKLWDVITTDLVYVRLHGHTCTYSSSYNHASLKKWADKLNHWINAGCDVHVYFDNDARGAAPKNAIQLLGMMFKYGISPDRSFQ